MTADQLARIFTYHRPTEDQQRRYVELRGMAKTLAEWINANCPESREKSLALTDLQRAVQMANASIAIHEASADAVESQREGAGGIRVTPFPMGAPIHATHPRAQDAPPPLETPVAVPPPPSSAQNS